MAEDIKNLLINSNNYYKQYSSEKEIEKQF